LDVRYSPFPIRSLILALLLAFIVQASAEAEPSVVRQLIPWLLDEDAAPKGVLFSEVIGATSGRRVIPVGRTDADNARVLKTIGGALDTVPAGMNSAGSPAKRQERVNERNNFFEDAILANLQGRGRL
jgi:hypothetical protein